MNDRFTQGFFAGVFAAVLSNLYGFLSKSIGFTDLNYADWASIMIFGQKASSLGEIIFAILGQIFFSGFLGVVFTFLIKHLLTSKNYLLKGWFFSVVTWFIIYAVTYLFKVPELMVIQLSTALSNFIAASIFGLSLAEILHRMQSRVF